ncbi:MAG: hypothetical protein AB8G15_08605 [Saprospiraceae bacterium]
MKNLILLLLLLGSTFALNANNLRITNLTNPSNNQITFNVAWDNAWQAGELHDAIWLFVKYRPSNSSQWSHAQVASATANGGFEIVTQSDQNGIFIKLDQDFIGNTPQQTITMNLTNLQGSFPDFKVFGMEMVYVPTDAFYLGDGAGGAEFRYSQASNINASYQVTSENAIANGTLAINTNAFNFIISDVPAGFPKGYQAFYCMKYEVTQQQYVDFLNTLTRQQQDTRTATNISSTVITNTYVMSNNPSVFRRQAIRCDANLPASGPVNFYCDLNNNGNGNEAADGMALACSFLSQNDLFAYLDWAALRPMSDFEFEKSARGPVNPVPKEFVWGTKNFTVVSGLTGSGTDAESFSNLNSNGLTNGMADPSNGGFYGPARVGFAASTTSNREQSGATYYGIMNLGDNVIEYTIIPVNGNSGKNYTGAWGDGKLSLQGSCDENDWGNFNTNYLHFRTGGFSGYYNNIPVSNFSEERAYLSHTGAFRLNAMDDRVSFTGGRGVR